MKNQQKLMLVTAMIMAFVAAALFFPGLIGAGDLDPSTGPGSTMKSLDQVPPTWSQLLPASDRFELVMNGDGVLDKETGLVWAKDADILSPETKTWAEAIASCRDLVIGSRRGWRLPTVEELASLVDNTRTQPSLPNGHPFTNVDSYYWSSTTYVADTSKAWRVNMEYHFVLESSKTGTAHVWPVRGGN